MSSFNNVSGNSPGPVATTASATAAAPARSLQAPASVATQPAPVPANATAPAQSAAPAQAPAPFSTAALLAAMLKSATKISDLFFSPGKPPMVEVNGKLAPVGARILTPDDTRHIASELIANNKHALGNLKDHGSCDVSYSLPGSSRFRVNVFMQRGTCAVVMRVIPSRVPSFEELHLPDELQQIVGLRNGIVLVTGPTGSGKSSTLAAVSISLTSSSRITF